MIPEQQATYERRGIPRRMWPLFERGAPGLEDTRALEHVQCFTSGVLVLSGGVGCGKSVAAAWLLAGRPGRFRRATDLQRAGLYDQEKLRELFDAALLVLDDVGMEYSDERGVFRSLLDDVINRRYDDLRDTIITTNLSADHFGKRYGQRILDRIREIGSFVGISDDSKRGRVS